MPDIVAVERRQSQSKWENHPVRQKSRRRLVRIVLNDRGLHTRGGEPRRQLRPGVPIADAGTTVEPQTEALEGFGWSFGFSPRADDACSQKKGVCGGGAGNRTL